MALGALVFAGLVLCSCLLQSLYPQDAGLAAAPWASRSLLVFLVPNVLPTQLS